MIAGASVGTSGTVTTDAEFRAGGTKAANPSTFIPALLIDFSGKFLITVGAGFGWSVRVEAETLTGISSGTPPMISGIPVARTCVVEASTPEALPVAEAPAECGLHVHPFEITG